MTEFVCAMIGLLLGAALYALGFFAARARERIEAPKTAEADEEARLRQIEADQRAFRILMDYNADVAYGKERLTREDGA
ncbi:MAG: hypothetical protein IK149_03235 [Oscillospiraceae bacterium]|nr:hypothetical protein [Oscillospiraceae bacterium]